MSVVWACAKKEIKSALTERATLLQCVTLPVNYLILLSLFVLSGSNAPTAVVMQDSGPYAQHFYQMMSQSHSFRLERLSATQAQATYQQGTLVAVVTIPADFETRMKRHQPVQIDAQINNLNEDLTDDVHRALQMSLLTFSAQVSPRSLPIQIEEHDVYAHDTDYIPFLSISILVICLMVSGLLQAGMAAAREWEKETIKELLMAPVDRGVVLLGKMLGAFFIGLLPVVVVLSVLILVIGDWPTNFPLVVGASLLILLVFVAAGTALGMVLKQRTTLTTLTRAIAVPLFFLSGIFGPISFQPSAVQVLARLFPTHYGIVLEQLGFKNFTMSVLSPLQDVLILSAFAWFFLGLAVLATQRGAIR